MSWTENPSITRVSKTSPWQAARRLAQNIPGAGPLVGVVVMLGFLAATAQVASVIYLSRSLSRVFLDRASLAAIEPLVVAGLLAVAVRAAAVSGGRMAGAELQYRVKASVRRRLLTYWVHEGPVLEGREGVGDKVAQLLEATEAVGALLSRYLPQVLLAAAVPVLMVIVIGREYWVAAVILLATAPIIPLLMVFIGRLAQERTQQQWDALARLGGHFLDIIGGLSTLVLFAQTARQHRIVGEVSGHYRRSVMRTLRVALLSALVLELFASIAMALVAVAVGLALMNGVILLVPALAVLILAPEFYGPQRALGGAFHQAIAGLTATEVLEAAWTPAVRRPGGGASRPLGPGPWSIRCEALRVRYPERGRSLSPVTLEIKAGEHVAVMGPSGVGKTSLLYALLGYVPVDSGMAFIGGLDLREMEWAWWRQQIGYVGQSSYLHFGSVRENLLAVRPDATDRDLWDALDHAVLRSFVEELPGRLDAPVGDRGYAWSGGQAQRLALARLWLCRAPMVFLDEPTEHLDPWTRAACWDGLDRYSVGRTVLLVTHRADETARMDRTVTWASLTASYETGRAGALGFHR